MSNSLNDTDNEYEIINYYGWNFGTVGMSNFTAYEYFNFTVLESFTFDGLTILQSTFRRRCDCMREDTQNPTLR